MIIFTTLKRSDRTMSKISVPQISEGHFERGYNVIFHLLRNKIYLLLFLYFRIRLDRVYFVTLKYYLLSFKLKSHKKNYTKIIWTLIFYLIFMLIPMTFMWGLILRLQKRSKKDISICLFLKLHHHITRQNSNVNNIFL